MANTINPPQIRHMATLWTLTDYGDADGEWSIDRKLVEIKNAGFDGFLGRVPVVTAEHVQQHGLLFAATVDIGDADEVEPKLRAINEVGAVCVNVQMLDHDTPTEEAITRARQVMETAGRLEMDVAIEVHRDTCTETPEKAYALAEGFEKAEGRPLKMTWDFYIPLLSSTCRRRTGIDWQSGLTLSNSPSSFTSVLLTVTTARFRHSVMMGSSRRSSWTGLSLRIGSSKSGCKRRRRGERCLSVLNRERWAIRYQSFRIDGRMCKPFEVRLSEFGKSTSKTGCRLNEHDNCLY